MRDEQRRKCSDAEGEPGWMCNCLALTLLVLAVTLGPYVLTALAATKTYILHDELFSVSFANEQEGWVCGDWGSILHTGDGGNTWEPQVSGTESTLSSIFFINPLNGWAVGNEGTILHTKDGGRSWASQESPVPFFHSDVFFVSPSKGWIASEMTHILYTENGGETWRVQFEDTIYNLAAISFSDEKHGWAVGEYGFIYHTNDGGRNWIHQAGYFRVSDETGDINTGVTLFDVIAMDVETGIAVGADGVVTRTTDGGATWEKLEGDIPPALFFGMATDEAGALVIGGKGVSLFSLDMGETWAQIQMNPSMTYRWLYGFDSPGSGRFVAVGEEGAIYLGQLPKQWSRVNYHFSTR